jgi:hypothetical protein
MSYKVKCTLRIYKANSSGLMDRLDEFMTRLYPGCTGVALSNKNINSKATVGKEYIIDTESEEEQHKLHCSLMCNCPAPFEVMMWRCYWKVEKIH